MKLSFGFTPLNNRSVQMMSHKVLYVSCVAAGTIFAAGELSAAEWCPVAAGPNVAIFVDKSSIKTKGKLKTFMQWQLFGQRIGTTDSAKTRIVFDCDNGMRKTEYLIAISQVDTVQSEAKVDDTFKPVVANSLEATVYQAVCQNKFDGQPQSTVNINDVRNFLYFNQAR